MLDFLTNTPLVSAGTEQTAELVFDAGKFISNLQYMGIGMLVIFIVIGVIILSTKLINYLFSDSSAE
jgi:hypothetical protein